MKKLTEQQEERILNEVLDPNKIMLVCSTHMYTPGGKSSPAPGCPNCVKAMFIYQLAHTSPEMRQLKLDALESIVNHMVEDEAKGVKLPKFYAHPQVHVEKAN